MTLSHVPTAGAARIAVNVIGEGPLVLCLPGMADLRSVYRFLAPALVAADYRVAAMDLRGHGDSDDGFDRYDDVAAGPDALALIGHLGGPAVLVGNSMSAGAAVWAAAEDPAKVSGLVLIGPFVRDPKNNPLLALAFRILRRGDHWRSFTRTTRTSHTPAAERLSQVQAPALIVMGERDQDWPDPAAEARFVAEAVGGELLLVPDAGHYPTAEYPELVNPAVVEFANRVSARA